MKIELSRKEAESCLLFSSELGKIVEEADPIVSYEALVGIEDDDKVSRTIITETSVTMEINEEVFVKLLEYP